MNRKLFYILLAVIGVSSALPVGQEHGDINDLSANGYVPADGYVPAENTELNEEDLSDRNKRQTKWYERTTTGPLWYDRTTMRPLRFDPITPRPDPFNYLNVAGGGNYQNGQNWHANGAVAGGAKVFESANQRHAIGVHGNYGQSAVNYPGYHYQSGPQWGAGLNYRIRF